jgi:hypothetical protein
VGSRTLLLNQEGSFTNTLIEVLEDWMDGPQFSAAMLHNKVLSALKHERAERAQNGKRRKIECQRNPIHMMGTAGPRLSSIELGRRISSSAHPSSERPPSDSDAINTATFERKGYRQGDFHNVNGDEFVVPRVVISLTLEDQNLDSATCEKWLASCPALVKFAKVEAVYKSFSTLLLLTVLVFTWNWLSEDPACSFVGYVMSTNLITTVSPPPRVKRQAMASSLFKYIAVPKASKSKKRDSSQTCTMYRRRMIKCDGLRPVCMMAKWK